MTSLRQVLGRKVTFDSVVEHMLVGFSTLFKVRFQPKSLSPDEVSSIQRIQKERYEKPAWLHGVG